MKRFTAISISRLAGIFQMLLKPRPSAYVARCALLFAVFSGCQTRPSATGPLVPKWHRFEQTFKSLVAYTNPVQQASLRVEFTSPTGEAINVFGFWDGGETWRVRFAPNQIGKWTYQTTCSDAANSGLHKQTGSFLCTASSGQSRFAKHGPVRVAPSSHYLMHDDRTPFFWLGDTAWNGALLSTPQEWNWYIRERVRQKFTAVQWVTTQWRGSPKGDRVNALAFTGEERIQINPGFFQTLDTRMDALNEAGLLSAPVLLWAIGGGSNPKVNPGFSLPEEQAILLARYMVARWGANDVVWILAGDGDYRGPKADRWKKIGRAVFGEGPHAPVMLHPGGMHWNWDDFKDEKWLDVIGYQSGHGDDDRALAWMINGPLTQDWKKRPTRPFINLEPPYENHVAYQSKTRISPHTVRRAIYWSLLNAPTAGVTYGGHGVWGWDDGTKPPTDHPNTGVPLPWQKALLMPGAEQMVHLVDFFNSIEWWQLSPAPESVVNPAGSPRRYNAAARSEKGDVLVVYVPEDHNVEIRVKALPPDPQVTWIDPRTGAKHSAVAVVMEQIAQFPTPGEGDWLLLAKTEKR
jgi:uncharacterized protein DUF4038/uncharacterized protein DUF5060/collagenase-like protein with putative collagen-binding domain